MTKKLLCVILSVVMLMGSLAVVGNALVRPYPGAETDPTYSKYETYTASCDYKELIDNKFFYAYDYHTGVFTESQIALNIYFWTDNVIDSYYAAETNEDYYNVYRLMMTPVDDIVPSENWGTTEEMFDYAYKYRDESKAEVDLELELDKTTAKPGDTVNLTLYCNRTNCYVMGIQLGVAFKNLVTPTEYHEDFVGWSSGHNLNYGFFKNGTDVRATYWPESMQTTEAYNTLKMVEYCMGVDSTEQIDIMPQIFTEKTNLGYFTMTVSDDAKPGDSITFYTLDEFKPSLAFDLSGDYNGNNRPTVITRTAGPMVKDSIDYYVGYDVTITCNSPVLTIVGDAPVVEDADYEALDTAIGNYDALSTDIYTSESLATAKAAYDAAKAVSRDLTADDQGIIDAAATALSDAIDALVEKAIISAEQVGVAQINSKADVNVTVTGSPDAISLSDGTLSSKFSRDDATITTDEDGNEVWAVKVLANAATTNYVASVSYDGEYIEETKDFVVTAVEGVDLTIHSIEIPDMYDGSLTRGKHTVIMTTTTDVWKIQFVDAVGGNTCTYATEASQYTSPTYTDKDGIRTWTLTFNFTLAGNVTYNFRTRSHSTTLTYPTAGVTSLDARIVY